MPPQGLIFPTISYLREKNERTAYLANRDPNTKKLRFSNSVAVDESDRRRVAWKAAMLVNPSGQSCLLGAMLT